MRPAVFDASVAVKIFLPVEGSAKAEAAARQYAMVSPELVLVETTNAFWKYVRKGMASRNDCLTAVKNLSGFAELKPDRTLYPDALELAAELDHPVYDCIYLALAGREKLPILSADKRMLDHARDLGLEAIDLADIEAEVPAP